MGQLSVTCTSRVEQKDKGWLCILRISVGELSVQVKEEKDDTILEKGDRNARHVRVHGLDEEKHRISSNRVRGSLYKASVNSVELVTKEKHHEDVRKVILD